MSMVRTESQRARGEGKGIDYQCMEWTKIAIGVPVFLVRPYCVVSNCCDEKISCLS